MSYDFVWLFLMVCLQFVVVVFPDHTHLLFLSCSALWKYCGLSITLPLCILAYLCVLFVSLCSCDSSSVYRMYVTVAFPGYIHLFIVCFNVFITFFFHLTHICQTKFPTFL